MTQKVFFNDKIMDIDQVCISPSDSGFLYGVGLFETMRAMNCKVYSLQEHLDRLFFSLEALQFPHNFTREFIETAIYDVLGINELVDARIRLTVTNGPMNPDEGPKPTLLITATDFKPYPEEYYENGIRVMLTSFRQNPWNPVFRHKTTNYMPRLMAINNAHQQGAAEALWFTVDNKLAEGCMTNVFLVSDSKLLTPPLSTPVLPGVARANVIKMAIDAGIEVEEKDLVINDLLDADEIFLTNVIMGVMPVVAVEKHVVGEGKVGGVTKNIMELFKTSLDAQCGVGV